MLEQSLLFLISFIANAFSAFAGGGAGLLQLPALIFLGLSFSVALATHKLASVALGVGATLRHWREGNLDKTFSLIMLATGVPGVILGALGIVHIEDRIAEIALGMLTILIRRLCRLRSLARVCSPVTATGTDISLVAAVCFSSVS